MIGPSLTEVLSTCWKHDSQHDEWNLWVGKVCMGRVVHPHQKQRTEWIGYSTKHDVKFGPSTDVDVVKQSVEKLAAAWLENFRDVFEQSVRTT